MNSLSKKAVILGLSGCEVAPSCLLDPFGLQDSSKRLGYKTHLNLKRFLSMWLILLLIFTTLYRRGTRSFLSQASCLDSKGPIQRQLIRARAPCQP